jgi:hypothetical protein
MIERITQSSSRCTDSILLPVSIPVCVGANASAVEPGHVRHGHAHTVLVAVLRALQPLAGAAFEGLKALAEAASSVTQPCIAALY